MCSVYMRICVYMWGGLGRGQVSWVCRSAGFLETPISQLITADLTRMQLSRDCRVSKPQHGFATYDSLNYTTSILCIKTVNL